MARSLRMEIVNQHLRKHESKMLLEFWWVRLVDFHDPALTAIGDLGHDCGDGVPQSGDIPADDFCPWQALDELGFEIGSNLRRRFRGSTL